MPPLPLTRRDFVASVGSLGAAWLLSDVDLRRDAMTHAQHQLGAAQPTLGFFTPEQAAEIEAFAARIYPADDTPGAREAGVVYFIDRGLTTWATGQQPAFTALLQKLPQLVSAQFAGQTRLSALDPAQQDQVLRSIEQTPDFGMVRFATLAGMFSLPSYGGNRDFGGWKGIGQDTELEYRPPFSWYDRPANRRTLPDGGEGRA
jgi:gluconate 2-dehydrogenase gamma chain